MVKSGSFNFTVTISHVQHQNKKSETYKVYRLNQIITLYSPLVVCKMYYNMARPIGRLIKLWLPSLLKLVNEDNGIISNNKSNSNNNKKRYSNNNNNKNNNKDNIETTMIK